MRGPSSVSHECLGRIAPVARLVAAIEDALIAQGSWDEDMSNLACFVRRGAGMPDGPMQG